MTKTIGHVFTIYFKATVQKKWSLLLRISSANVKNPQETGFAHIYWRNP